MKIAMFTNLYLPKVGGVAISVKRFADAYRDRGHEVLIVAPEFPDQPEDEAGVVRTTALQNFNGTDFSVAHPPGKELSRRLDDFRPDLIHSHHPFLLGDSAARLARHRHLPLVYTHHTMYEYYTHYVPGNSRTLRHFAIELATRYTRFCSLVMAPSQSVADILKDRGIEAPIEIVPTGVAIDEFASGSRDRGRDLVSLDEEPFVIGHVGRLAPEKNLTFLTQAVARALQKSRTSRFMVVGGGRMKDQMQDMMARADLADRAVFAGIRKGQKLADLYAAMDVFAFASKSETQGMVLAEALAAGTPVVALDAPGAREVVRDEVNGRHVQQEDEADFAQAILDVQNLSGQERKEMRNHARDDARKFSLERCVEKALSAYQDMLDTHAPKQDKSLDEWDELLNAIRREWDIWSNRVASLSEAVFAKGDPRKQNDV